MKKQTINPHWLHVLLDPLSGLADDDASVQYYRPLDTNVAAAVRSIIRKEVVPYFARIDVESQMKIKNVYGYYLTQTCPRWNRVFDSMLLPFPPPTNVRLFFLWIWQECFPNEEYRLDEQVEYQIKEDIEEPLRVMKLAKE